MRKSKNDYYLDIALAVAERSTCLKKRYGAVIVKNDEIIATGYNGAPRDFNQCCDINHCERMHDTTNNYSNCIAVHAEQNAMLSAKRQDMINSTLYLAGYDDVGKQLTKPVPCPICARMICNAGIVRVVTVHNTYDISDVRIFAKGEYKYEIN